MLHPAPILLHFPLFPGQVVVYLPASANPPRRLGVWKPNTVDPLTGVLQSLPRPTKQV